MGLTPRAFGIEPADVAAAQYQTQQRMQEQRRRELQSQALADNIEPLRIDWNLLDVSDNNVGAGTPVARLSVHAGIITLPLRNRKTGVVTTLSGPGIAGSIGAKVGLSSVTAISVGGKNGLKFNPANEAAKRVPSDDQAQPISQKFKIQSETGVPIFKGPAWNDSKGVDQLTGLVGISTLSLLTPSRESIGIFNFFHNLIKDPSSVVPRTNNVVGVFFYNWTAVPFITLRLPPPPTSLEAVCLCRTKGHSSTLLGISAKGGYFKCRKITVA